MPPRFHSCFLVVFSLTCCSAQEVNADGKGNELLTISKALSVQEDRKVTNMGLRYDRLPHAAHRRRLQNKKGGGGVQDCTKIATKEELQTAIEDAANNPSNPGTAQVVKMCDGTITISGPPISLDLPNPVALQCSKPKACVITAKKGDTSEGFVELSGGSLGFEGIVVRNFIDGVFSVSGDGTTLTLTNSEFNKNVNNNDVGGVIKAESCTLIIISCIFRGNVGQYAGGVIVQQGGKFVVTDTSFDSNEAYFIGFSLGGGGGTFALQDVEADVQNSSFKKNKGNNGGAIYITGTSSVTINEGCSFENNRGSGRGGAIYVEQDSILTLSTAMFKGNKASLDQCNNIFYENPVGGAGFCGP